jgi:hypothetical protein
LNRVQEETLTGVEKLEERLKRLGEGGMLTGLIKEAEGLIGLFKGICVEGGGLDYSGPGDEYRARTDNGAAGSLGSTAATGSDEKTGAEEELANNGGLLSAGPDEGAYETRLLFQQQYHQAALSETQRFIDAQTEMKRRGDEAELRLDSEKWDNRLRNAGYAAGVMANLMQNLSVVMGSKGKAAFTAMKALAIAETVIQTYRAAQGAYAALAWINPALGIAAAATATVAGLARVKQIQSMTPSGGTISVEGTASPSYSGGSYSAYPATTNIDTTDTQQPTQNVTINIHNPLSDQNWDAIAEDIVDAINKAGERNMDITIKTTE